MAIFRALGTACAVQRYNSEMLPAAPTAPVLEWVLSSLDVTNTSCTPNFPSVKLPWSMNETYDVGLTCEAARPASQGANILSQK